MTTVKTIIIDDDFNNSVVLKQLILIEGAEVITLSSVKQLDQVIENNQNIDLIFLDMDLPDINGFDVLPMIRSNPHFQNTKIIAYTVYLAGLHEIVESGFDGMIGKPVNGDLFSEQFHQLLNGEPLWYIP